MKFCEFRLTSVGESGETVACIHCGRPVTLPDAASRRIIANCRGSAETRWKDGAAMIATLHQGGPGTELSRLLKRFGIEPTPTCACRAKAAEMDRWGPDECSRPERIDEVVAVMREEAKARNLPFLDAAGRLLVRRAIANARRAAAAN